MNEALYLSRVSLRRDADMRALAPTLVPDDADARIAAGHRLAWALFAGDPERKRDFLWREEAPGRLIVLSSAPPSSGERLFDIDTRVFAALPREGERFAFALRANPTISLAQHGEKKNGKRKSGKPVDVIMQALHATPGRRGLDGRMARPLAAGQDRPFMRDALLGWLDDADSAPHADPRRPALDWLIRQGEKNGFALDADQTRVVSYRRVATPRRRGARPAAFGQVEFEGTLRVTDAEAFLKRLRKGFGRAKAFGCGLMLLARAGAR